MSEDGENCAIEGHVGYCFAADEESRAITARKMQKAADVVILVEGGKQSLRLFEGVGESREGYRLAEV